MVLLRVRHEDFAIEISDAERRITSRKVRVDEAVGIHLMKVFIEGVDLARMKICRIQKIVTVRDAERCAFVNRAVNAVVRTVIDSNDGVSSGSSVGFQPEMEPSSLTKMKKAGAEFPFFVTWKNMVLLRTCPVGLPPSLFRAAVGIVTTSERAVPSCS